MRWTALYAGLLAFIYIALAFRVIGLRRGRRIGIGDGGDRELARAIRVHANFAENAPLALLLIGMLELNGGPLALVHACGAALLVGRIGHAYGLSRSIGSSLGRVGGMVLTYLAMMAAGGYGLVAALLG